MERLSEEYINQAVLRHTREAASELDALAAWAISLAKDIRRAPTVGFSAHGGETMLNSINARLARADALYSLIEKQ